MAEKILLSTAYLPPLEYFSLISKSNEVLIEHEENFIKQTYRNRCYILSSEGLLALTVPVYLGSFHKTRLKDIRIDYTKRWQQVHLGAINASYRSSPFFEFYYEEIEKPILKNHEYLIDLNSELFESLIRITGTDKPVNYTTSFISIGSAGNDYRYEITPKSGSTYRAGKYTRVFNNNSLFDARISIIDLIFNTGPDSAKYL
jgi:hypothetical protein